MEAWGGPFDGRDITSPPRTSGVFRWVDVRGRVFPRAAVGRVLYQRGDKRWFYAWPCAGCGQNIVSSDRSDYYPGRTCELCGAKPSRK
jgi:hypothetical protein